MNIRFQLCVMTVLFALSSGSAQAVKRCINGDIPKFKNNTATFHVEPLLWNHLETRKAIVDAFNDWNQATGWMMNLIVLPATSNGGNYNDKIFQVRSDWLLFNEVEGGFIDTNLAQNVALPTQEAGQQCYWWDNDIVFNKAFMPNGYFSNDYISTYGVMLHEVSHAMGFNHTAFLSVVNPENFYNTSRGLFGHDIQAARQLYGTYPENLRRNFRTDDVMLQPDMVSTGNVGVGDEFIDPSGLAVSEVILPYNVTNTGPYGEHVNIELLGARNEWELYNGRAQVLQSFREYIGPGSTAAGWKRFNVSRAMLGQIHQYGFRVLANDDNPSDNIRAVR